MSILDRLALVLKSLTKTTSDRIDRIAAEEELRESRSMGRAADGLESTISQPQAPSPTVSPQLRKLEADYRLLGLKPGADLAAVEEAWRRLASRADPKRFPAGSEEEKRAAEILKSLNASYARLREALNPTEGRFGQLEL